MGPEAVGSPEDEDEDRGEDKGEALEGAGEDAEDVEVVVAVEAFDMAAKAAWCCWLKSWLWIPCMADHWPSNDGGMEDTAASLEA